MTPLFPKIQTKRLILDKLSLEDAPLIAKYAGDRKISEYTLSIPYPYTLDDAVWWINHTHKSFEENKQHAFGVYLQESKSLIGGIGLVLDLKNQKASLGYWVAVPFWNQGYATEATKAILRYGFETLGLNKIYAQHIVVNQSSGKVMQKAGMILEGELKEHTMKDDILRDLKQYRLTKSEYKDL